METMTGTVDAVRKDGKGFCIDDVWYSSWDPVSVSKGDAVVFNFVEKGRYKNIKGKVRVESGGSAPAASGSKVTAKWSNVGVELGHAANLAQRIMEVMYCEDQLDKAEVEIGSAAYYAMFAEQTLRAYKVMKNLRSKVEAGDDAPSSAVKPAKVEPNPAPVVSEDSDLEEDIFG